jgi:hypothetical protein
MRQGRSISLIKPYFSCFYFPVFFSLFFLFPSFLFSCPGPAFSITPHYSPCTGPGYPEQQATHSADYGDARKAEIAISERFLHAFGPEAYEQELYQQVGRDFLFHR